MRPRYSVIVPAYNAAEKIEACLQALLDQSTSPERYEVLVVDDGSTDATTQLAGRFPVRVLHQEHMGPAIARNHGAEEARGQLLLFTDSDCVPIHTWIEEIVRPLEADDQVAGCRGSYLTHQTGLVPRIAQVEFEEKFARLRRHPYIDFIDTASAAFRADAFWEAGGFDSAFSNASNEDTQLSFALVKAGWRLVFCERAVVYHQHATTLTRYLQRKWRHGYWRVLVYREHPNKMRGDSYTPRSTQVQMVSAAVAVTLIGVPRTRWLAVGSLGVFATATLPFVRRALPVGYPVAASVPPVLFLRALALAAGLSLGGLRLLLFSRPRPRAPVAHGRPVRSRQHQRLREPTASTIS